MTQKIFEDDVVAIDGIILNYEYINLINRPMNNFVKSLWFSDIAYMIWKIQLFHHKIS